MEKKQTPLNIKNIFKKILLFFIIKKFLESPAPKESKIWAPTRLTSGQNNHLIRGLRIKTNFLCMMKD